MNYLYTFSLYTRCFTWSSLYKQVYIYITFAYYAWCAMQVYKPTVIHLACP